MITQYHPEINQELHSLRIREENKPLAQISSSSPIGKLSLSSGPHLPYKVVVHMANSCLTPFIKAAHDFVAPSNSPSSDLNATSCINNLHALIVLFSGAAKAKQIAENLRYMNNVPISVTLSNSKKWDYRVISLVAGEFLLKFRNLPENENTKENRDKVANLFKHEIIGDFFKHT